MLVHVLPEDNLHRSKSPGVIVRKACGVTPAARTLPGNYDAPGGNREHHHEPSPPPAAAVGGKDARKRANSEMLEGYSLLYAPRSYRKWSEFAVANTALGGIAYLADFAIGGSLSVSLGFQSATFAILRGGFGYFGGTVTSLIYASFTFIFFALEGSIMAQGLHLGLHIPLWLGYGVSALMIPPLVVFGMTLLSKMQLLTPAAVARGDVPPLPVHRHQGPERVRALDPGRRYLRRPRRLSFIALGAGAGIALSLIAQIGEQVDYLRFMPPRTPKSNRPWWTAVVAAGPGWVILGALKQLGGAFLAFYVVGHIGQAVATQPVHSSTRCSASTRTSPSPGSARWSPT